MIADKASWAADKEAFRRETHPPDVGPLADQFADLTKNLLNATTVVDVLEQVVRATRQAVPGADLVSVTLRSPDGAFHTPVETDPVASALDRLQYATGEGPCLDAALNPGPAQVRSDDLAVEPAWPRFGPAAATRGVHAVLSATLLPGTRTSYPGALNIYSRTPGGLGVRAHEPALLLASHASLALAGTAAVTHAELTVTNLRKAIDSRDVIGQAKGILMARRGIDAGAAFDELRRTSQELNIKLVDLAQLLATRHTELDQPSVGDTRGRR